jgi:hypothetical protein
MTQAARSRPALDATENSNIMLRLSLGANPMSCRALLAATALLVQLPVSAAVAQPAPNPFDGQTLPGVLKGPFVSRTDVVTLLDCPPPDCAGPLSFSRLLQAVAVKAGEPAEATGNSFNLRVARRIKGLIEQDLAQIRHDGDATDRQLDPKFLSHPGSRVELVGVINRMDRQFIKDSFQRKSKAQRDCGEISLIYRFAYSIPERNQASRLPVTMNLVFPALPSDTQNGAITCQQIAQRWRDEVQKSNARSAQQIVSDLFDAGGGPLAFLKGEDLERVELNMQAYRNSASSAPDFGTKSEYLIRVFKWDAQQKLFVAAPMTNQLDRSKVLCNGNNDPDCAAKKERRRKLVEFLQTAAAVSALDKGQLDIPFELDVLAERATSMSPGGSHRSANQPFWKAKSASQEVISDAQIAEAIKNAIAGKVQFSFIKTVDDFRTRLNDSTCTGCHQTRAIAGFHFPGADRDFLPGGIKTPPANAVLLPGSPHFYGDQLRRMEILKLMATRANSKLFEHELATSYSARPMNRFGEQLKETHYVGGWGGACLIDKVAQQSQRKWRCRSDLGLMCKQLFESANSAGIGTCVPEEFTQAENPALAGKPKRPQIGDAMQHGTVTSSSFGQDKYKRTEPKEKAPLIPPSALPHPAPAGNSFYGSHQEFFTGKKCPDEDPGCTTLTHEERRDRLTGGFPAGMLRLSECTGLADEATCGLIASSGFNDCVTAVGNGTLLLGACFSSFTSFAGVRACTAAKPCRDDYICVKPMDYTAANADEKFQAREQELRNPNGAFRKINKRDFDPTDFGQQRPDGNWLQRGDTRGLCIPPYFVFQFRSDGHPKPP